MNTKFEFVPGDTATIAGITLTRIRALRDIPEENVKAGDLGGYLQSEENLCSSGAAWASGEAQVSGKASISPICISGFRWIITITDKHMRIGCQFHEIEAFEAFTDREIAAVDGKHSLRFWRENKDWLMASARAHAKRAARAKG